MTMRLDPIEAILVDGLFKGYPGTADPRPLSAIGKAGWNVLRGDVPFPCAVLKTSALEANRAWMSRFIEGSGCVLAPHGKTTMCPQIFAMQLDDGAWGITAATVEQLQVYRRFGVSRVLMANQLVGRAAIAFVVAELNRDPGFTFFCLADSVEGVRILAATARDCGATRPIDVLVEIGSPLGRTGVRDAQSALAVAEAVIESGSVLRLAGAEVYEFAVKVGDEDEREERAALLLQTFGYVVQALDAAGAFADVDEIVLSGGGTNFIDMAAGSLAGIGLSRPTRCIVRSGCYVSIDHLGYTRAFDRIRERLGPRAPDGGLVPALEVWACVQSRPEDNRAFATAGKRDLSYDLELPTPVSWSHGGGPAKSLGPGHAVTALNDQHLYLKVPPSSPLGVGDLIGFGISHPCTTFDKWRLIYLVNDVYDITGAVLTFF